MSSTRPNSWLMCLTFFCRIMWFTRLFCFDFENCLFLIDQLPRSGTATGHDAAFTKSRMLRESFRCGSRMQMHGCNSSRSPAIVVGLQADRHRRVSLWCISLTFKALTVRHASVHLVIRSLITCVPIKYHVVRVRRAPISG